MSSLQITGNRTAIILVVLLIVVAVGAGYVRNSLATSKRWEIGYAQISEGDSKAKVIDVLGNPTEIKDCFAATFGSREIGERCFKEYWYIAFLQEWVYVIDKDGKVIAKWHSVSP